jgi:hypothetical protein
MTRWLVSALVAGLSIGMTIGTGAALAVGRVPGWWVAILVVNTLAAVVWTRTAARDLRELRRGK